MDGRVFPGSRGRALSDAALRVVLRRMHRSDITVHGFRSCFRDWAAETTTYQREVVEAAPAHTIDSKVEAAYRRGNLLEKRRRLMSDWAAFCGRVVPVGDTTVVAFAGARA
jgi:integrase